MLDHKRKEVEPSSVNIDENICEANGGAGSSPRYSKKSRTSVGAKKRASNGNPKSDAELEFEPSRFSRKDQEHLQKSPQRSACKPPEFAEMKQNGKSSQDTEKMQTTKSKTGGRFDNSLGQLTARFLRQVRESATGIVDLNLAADQLGVPKRRVYDITNVLEGIGVIEKTTKNKIAWKEVLSIENIESDPTRSSDEIAGDYATDEISKLKKELEHLQEQEKSVDQQIEDLQKEIRSYTSGEKESNLAFVTFDDIRSIPEFRGHTIIAIKAPTGTELTVPDNPEESADGRKRHQIFLKSSGGPIEYVLVSDASDETGTMATPECHDNAIWFSPEPPLASFGDEYLKFNASGGSSVVNRSDDQNALFLLNDENDDEPALAELFSPSES